MKVVAIYHPKSDHGGLVEDYAEEFEHYKGKKIELLSLETQAGADMANLYDIVNYPAFLAIDDSGSMQRIWQGTQLPLMDDLSYYVHEPDNEVSHHGRIINLPAGSALAASDPLARRSCFLTL